MTLGLNFNRISGTLFQFKMEEENIQIAIKMVLLLIERFIFTYIFSNCLVFKS